jgi:DNA-3-methyladenine glycosylase
MAGPSSNFDWLSGDVVAAARQLLGCIIAREIDGTLLVGRIVETEAYHQSDAASHSYKGRTPRTAIMFGPPGYLYVYFTYGMHYCMNVVTGPEGEGSAVLIRAIEPLEGIELMRSRRRGLPDNSLTNGPAKVCQALAVDKQLNGHDLSAEPLVLRPGDTVPSSTITATTRIGITKDAHRLWRFYIRDNPFVSKPR